MADFGTLAAADQALLTHLLQATPALAKTVAVAKRLNLLVRRTSSDNLTDVLAAADETRRRDRQ